MRPPTTKSLKKKILDTLKKQVRKEANGRCYTCGKIVGYENLQGGHFLHEAKHSPVAFEKRLLKAQCISCNYWKSGNLQEYTIKMINEYGYEQVIDWKRQAKQVKKWSIKELLEIIKKI